MPEVRYRTIFRNGLTDPAFLLCSSARHRRPYFIGATRQLIGGTGSPFAYRGSIGPWPTNELLTDRLKELGNAIAGGFGLAGWFGVDFVLNAGVPWLVEINPRYTASVELYELAWRRSLFDAHRRACEGTVSNLYPPADLACRPPRIIAKWILYASQSMVVPAIVPHENETEDVFAVSSIADVPPPGTCVNPDEPVMTLLAAGDELTECRSRLFRLEQHWTARLGIVGDALPAASL